MKKFTFTALFATFALLLMSHTANGQGVKNQLSKRSIPISYITRDSNAQDHQCTRSQSSQVTLRQGESFGSHHFGLAHLSRTNILG